MTDAGLVDGVRTHHDLAVHEVLLLLQTDHQAGLTEDEAARRLQLYGRNELPRATSVSWPRRLVRQVHNPLVYVLIAAAAVTGFLREFVDTGVIVGVVLVNAVVGFIQESRAESALDALRSMVHAEAGVTRGGRLRRVHSELLAPGDLVLVEAGDKVPADLRLLEATELRVDESALTGESLPVAKDVAPLPPSTPVADRRDMAYSGTLVTGGAGRGIVVATGGATEVGEIHRLVGAAKPLTTPLTRKLATFSGWLTVVILALAAVTFGMGVLRGEPAAEMFTAAVALAVGAIPEGLPAAVTITLAIGVSRMARRRAVIRRLPAVETLGGATVICSDKTGTLTHNRMTVRSVWTVSGHLSLPDDGTSPATLAAAGLDQAQRSCLLAGAVCNDATLHEDGTGVGDPTDLALLKSARVFGLHPHGMTRLRHVPFSSERQYMATLSSDPTTGGDTLMVKGSVERVLDLCAEQLTGGGTVEPVDRTRVLDAAESLGDQGMRVLATATQSDNGADAFELLADGGGGGLVLTGLQAMHDPPRGTAAAAVGRCREAGLQVKMITGDQPATAASVARMIGLLDGGGRTVTGPELDRVAPERLPQVVEEAVVFARVSPAQKLLLVQALQARHHVVAMTGDGVNDAPALRQADIGVAMGRGGTEVAKDASDMVLTDDDFATIEAAVEEGRGVFDNLIKFIAWTLPTNMGEGMVILVAILLGTTLPILPTQILWINMTTAVALGLMLAWEPREPDIMRRPPRDPRRSLLTGPIVLRTLLVSALLVAGSWWVFEQELSAGASLPASRTAAVNLFVMVEAFYLFSCRSLTRPLWRVGATSNPLLLVGVAVQAAGQLALTYLPAMNVLFQTAPIEPRAWARILLVSVGAALVVALDKRRLRGTRL